MCLNGLPIRMDGCFSHATVCGLPTSQLTLMTAVLKNMALTLNRMRQGQTLRSIRKYYSADHVTALMKNNCKIACYQKDVHADLPLLLCRYLSGQMRLANTKR